MFPVAQNQQMYAEIIKLVEELKPKIGTFLKSMEAELTPQMNQMLTSAQVELFEAIDCFKISGAIEAPLDLVKEAIALMNNLPEQIDRFEIEDTLTKERFAMLENLSLMSGKGFMHDFNLIYQRIIREIKPVVEVIDMEKVEDEQDQEVYVEQEDPEILA